MGKQTKSTLNLLLAWLFSFRQQGDPVHLYLPSVNVLIPAFLSS